MKHPPCSVVAAATAILAVVLAIGGCSTEGDAGKASDTAATASNGDAAMLLKQATDAMRKVTGMHVRLAVTGDVPNLRVTKLEGDISNTPQTVATGSATLLVGNKSEDAKFVYVDGHLYSDLGQPGTYTDFGNGASIYNVSVLLDPNKGLANLLANLKDASVAGSQQADGVATTKITGNSSADDIATLAGRRTAGIRKGLTNDDDDYSSATVRGGRRRRRHCRRDDRHPGSRTSKCRRCLWRNCLLRQRLVGPIVGLPNPGGCRSHRRQVVWLLRTARCSPVSPPAAPSPPTIGHTREELDPPWPPP